MSLSDERELRLALGKGHLLDMCVNFLDFGRGCVEGGFHSIVGTLLVSKLCLAVHFLGRPRTNVVVRRRAVLGDYACIRVRRARMGQLELSERAVTPG